MQRNPKILAFSGSSRKGSFNLMLLKILTAAAEAAGGEVATIDLRDLDLPIYDGDLENEKGVPDAVRKLRAQMIASDGLLIVSPEYNGSVSSLLKNTLDWCSRPADGVEGLAPYKGKAVLLAAASVSPFGGVRGLMALRTIMAKMGAVVLADDLAVAGAHAALSDTGALVNPGTVQAAKALADSFVQFARMLHVSKEISGKV